MKPILTALILITCIHCSHAKPVVFYSDLTSGPKTGGMNDKGIWVTINGKNFGEDRGESFVTIGAGIADNYPLWSDTKIIFQLGGNASTGNIEVHTSSGTSTDGAYFTVRPGNIYFVDAKAARSGIGSHENPWTNPKSFFEIQSPGDTCYFREGTYTGIYGSSANRPYCVSYYKSGIGGAEGNEIAWVGYPGETAVFKADGKEVQSGSFEVREGRDYIVIANLIHYGMGNNHDTIRLQRARHIRFINNKITGLPPGTQSYGIIGILGPCSDIKIYGNEVYDVRSGNKLDHAVYFQGGQGADISDVDIGWNVFRSLDLNTGPIFSWNIYPSACTGVMIHDNTIDNSRSSRYLRVAGMWSLGSGSKVNFYNNLVIEASVGPADAASFYIGGGTAHIYGNTFYRSYSGNRSAPLICTYRSEDHGTNGNAVIKNNTFHALGSMLCATNNGDGTLLLDSNSYGGGIQAPESDKHPVKIQNTILKTDR